MELIFEDKEICKTCGGKCCKKCGCDYAPKDFESLSIDYLQQKLSEGNISIVSAIFFDKLKDGRLTCMPLLYLRARNTDRPVVDLLSLKTTCSLLKEDGGPYDYENRPSGAKNVIPSLEGCKPFEDPVKLIIEPWGSYQKVLTRLVKRMTGYSVEQKLSMDVEKLFTDIKDRNFKNVSKAELVEMLEFIPFLAEVYDEELKKVMGSSPKIISMHSLLTNLSNKLK